MSKLTVGFSPCPNDTFIFYHLLHEQPELSFDPVIEDVEQLNLKAIAQELDVTKVSMAIYPLIKRDYQLLDSGSALGFNCGPILITKPGNDLHDLARCVVAIPGSHTTATLLLSQAFPQATNKKEMLFSTIEDALLRGEVDAGVIIHESRFTYEKKGLQKVMDLGEWWHAKTGLPIPLGGIAAKRNLGQETINKVEFLLADSVRFAMNNPEAVMSYVRQYAQEMDEAVMKQHIDLYVNEFTLSLGTEGLAAIEELIGPL